ncbi:twin-arginine translocation signal domain-containing protein [Kineococcus sp. SYSU DK001]|uniref:twin-arginine translocation signal domain-containing protein n=1 Tax=Kineococcus sp. SYSU DK001 TaxID=3383122 RepID=UPI003D7CBBAF
MRRRDFLATTATLGALGALSADAPPPAPYRSGAYVGWPQTPATLDAFAAARGRPLDVVGDYLDGRDWDHLRTPAYLFDTYAGSAYAGRLVLSLPLIPVTASLADAADGRHVDHWAQLAEGLLAHGMGSIVVRPGWEANSPVNYPWSAVPDPQVFRAAFGRCVGALREVAPGLRVDFCVTAAVDAHAVDLADVYPGDDVVDVVGLDVYDMRPTPATDAERWAWYRSAPGGLDEIARFAREHGKPVAVDEWAVASPGWGGGGDNPGFVDEVVTWLDSVHTTTGVAHEIYNEVVYDHSDGRLFSGGANPRAAARYRELVGGS